MGTLSSGTRHSPLPIIVSAWLDPDAFAWLDGLRRAHFPAARNLLDAHLTLFHALPPSLEPELKRRLSSLTRGRPLVAEASGLVSLGRGGAVRIVSPQLTAMREELAGAFFGMLTRSHMTIQNKVSTAQARDLLSGSRRGYIKAGHGSRWRNFPAVDFCWDTPRVPPAPATSKG